MEIRASNYKFFFALIIFSFFGAKSLIAQKTSTKKGNFIEKGELKNNSEELLAFPNINRVAYYQDKSAMQKILKLDKNKEWEKLFPELRKYVYNFGIDNFFKDNYSLWRLAKLTELYGDMEEAKSLYRLLLKHFRSDLDFKSIELHYDSLTTNNKDYYVPLEYYYELVEFRKAIDTLRPPRGILLNMGSVVNSKYEDYGPAMSLNADILFFTSKRNKIRIGPDIKDNEDIFFTRNYDGYWDTAESLKGINTPYNEGSPCISKDGKRLYFSRCECPDCFGNCDIFSADKMPDDTWGNVKNLGAQVNSPYWDSQPSLSHTEDTLFFASNRIGGFGLSDIYYSIKDKNGNWGAALNAGPIINTRKNDVSPFFHPVYNVLYFSSNGQLANFGEFDIYKTNLINGLWEEPKNIGPLVNGAGPEYYFTIDADATKLFYARGEATNKKNLDLFSFPLPMEAQPSATAKLYGSLTDSLTGLPYSGIVSIIDLDHGIEVAPKYIRPDGSFEFNLIDRNNYLLIIQGDQYFRIEEVFFMNGETRIDKITEPISSKLKFTSIEFEEGKAEIRTEMYEDLNRVINFLLDNPDFKLKISGHTDSAGNPDFNLRLSQRRADAIRDFILLTGSLEDDRVEARGYGSTKAIVKELTDEDKKLNRRVEFEISRAGIEEN